MNKKIAKENKASLESASLYLLFAVSLFAVTYAFLSPIWTHETRYIVVDSEITSIQTFENEDGIDYLLITFENNESYKISPKSDMDFTVNSKLILELGNNYYRNWWWEDLEPDDDVYYVSKIIKVPE